MVIGTSQRAVLELMYWYRQTVGVMWHQSAGRGNVWRQPAGGNSTEAAPPPTGEPETVPTGRCGGWAAAGTCPLGRREQDAGRRTEGQRVPSDTCP